MDAFRLLWVDLCSQSPAHGLFQLVPTKYDAVRVDRLRCIVDAVHQVRPGLACIEFDYPDMTRLQAVSILKGTFPELPLLMFTEYHSEALAVWAFRSGVCDYRVKPVPTQTLLMRCIEILLVNHGSRRQDRQGPWLPPDLIEPAGHLRRPPSTSRKTGTAVAYIAQHFEQDLKRDALAKLSHVSPSEFSRSFRREQRTTFKHFLLEYRIARARDFIAEAQMTISEVAYASGFCDTSYFSRVFRQMVGVTASEYQRRARLAASRSHTSD